MTYEQATTEIRVTDPFDPIAIGHALAMRTTEAFAITDNATCVRRLAVLERCSDAIYAYWNPKLKIIRQEYNNE